MSEPEGTGPEHEDDPKEEILLPSWIDAAISRTRDDAAESAPALPPPLPDDAVEPMPEEPTYDHAPTPPVTSLPESEPFPAFLDRRSSMEYANEMAAEPEAAHEPAYEPAHDATPEAMPSGSAAEPPENFLRRRVAEDFEAQRAAIVSEAMAEQPERHEPIPLPVAPPRKRAPSGPWLMAALFFAAAALVLGILIWLRPLH